MEEMEDDVREENASILALSREYFLYSTTVHVLPTCSPVVPVLLKRNINEEC